MKVSEQQNNCIVCPMSCEGTVHFEKDHIKAVNGFSCQCGMDN